MDCLGFALKIVSGDFPNRSHSSAVAILCNVVLSLFPFEEEGWCFLGEEERVTLTDRHVEIWKAHSKQADLTIQNCMVIEQRKQADTVRSNSKGETKGRRLGTKKSLKKGGVSEEERISRRAARGRRKAQKNSTFNS